MIVSQLSQLSKVTGVPVEGDGFLPEAASFLSNLGRAQLPTLALSVALLVLLLLVSWRAPRAPGPLIVVVLGALVVALFALQDHGIQVVGPVPLGAGAGRPRCLGHRSRGAHPTGVRHHDRRPYRQCPDGKSFR